LRQGIQVWRRLVDYKVNGRYCRQALEKDPLLLTKGAGIWVGDDGKAPFDDTPLYAFLLAFVLLTLYKEWGLMDPLLLRRELLRTLSSPRGVEKLMEGAWEVLFRHGNPVPLQLASYALEEGREELLARTLRSYREGSLDRVLLDALSLGRNHLRSLFKERRA
jgi:hypothetical protein